MKKLIAGFILIVGIASASIAFAKECEGTKSIQETPQPDCQVHSADGVVSC